MRNLFLISLISLFSLNIAKARVVVISDFDDTIKQANSKGSFLASSYHFLRKKPYLQMRDLFKELKKHYGRVEVESKSDSGIESIDIVTKLDRQTEKFLSEQFMNFDANLLLYLKSGMTSRRGTSLLLGIYCTIFNLLLVIKFMLFIAENKFEILNPKQYRMTKKNTKIQNDKVFCIYL